MRHRAVLLLAGLAIVTAAALAAQDKTSYRARLSTVPIDLAMQATITGSGGVTATLTGRTLVLTGAFAGLTSPATAVRLHRSIKTGVRGDAVADLTATDATSGAISGSVDLTPAQVDDLANGRLYIQLHSEQAADGNLWGWLLTEGKK